MTKNTRRKGYIWEQVFFTEALKHGLEVFTPLGDYLPQDCIVVNSAGKKFNVQIKGSSAIKICKKNKGMGRYQVNCTSGSGNITPVDCTKVDVVSVYCADIDLWYLIPCMALDGATVIGLYPHNPDSKAKHEKYKDNWDIFKTPWKFYPPPRHNGKRRTISVRRLTQECEL